ncbi:TPA: hypothetical protein I7264_03225 [Vibrio parahaemolyticus]|nr:hypothetical protein [Vibrio parahaemolyticus]HAS6394552.1 hypothetical protein [Vibrio vulnificus]MDG2604266.1 hypothetical protein [Vibrio parahaemolyticus]HAS6610677.1 hypothetical protein [Vibrio parahaemolyticus]HAS6621289.1 hypothetical protein [Vibrio parahaemolyticus]
MRNLSLSIKFQSVFDSRMPLAPIVRVLDCTSDFVIESIESDIDELKTVLMGVDETLVENLEVISKQVHKGELQTLFLEDVRKGSFEFLLSPEVMSVAKFIAGYVANYLVGIAIESHLETKQKKTAETYEAELKGKIYRALDEESLDYTLESESGSDGELLFVKITVIFNTDYGKQNDPDVHDNGGREIDIEMFKKTLEA